MRKLQLWDWPSLDERDGDQPKSFDSERAIGIALSHSIMEHTVPSL